MKTKHAILPIILGSLAAGPSARAIALVDTGAPTSGSSVVTSPTLGMAAEFELGNDSLISEIQGYMNVQTAGNLTIAVHEDGGDTPGGVLFSTSIPLVAGPSDWRGAAGLNWNVPAGTHWVHFRADATLEFGMPAGTPAGGAPVPLGNEARLFDGGSFGFYWFPDPGDDLDFGVRIFGTEATASVPEGGSTLGLSAVGMAAVAGWSTRYRKKARRSEGIGAARN